MNSHDWRPESQYDTDPDSDWWRCVKCKALTRNPSDNWKNCPVKTKENSNG